MAPTLQPMENRHMWCRVAHAAHEGGECQRGVVTRGRGEGGGRGCLGCPAREGEGGKEGEGEERVG